MAVLDCAVLDPVPDDPLDVDVEPPSSPMKLGLSSGQPDNDKMPTFTSTRVRQYARVPPTVEQSSTPAEVLRVRSAPTTPYIDRRGDSLVTWQDWFSMDDGHREAAAPSLRDIIRMGRQVEGARAIEEASAQALEVFEPGERIPGSQYEVERSLCEGDSAVLYEVRHQQIRKQAVAKILKSSLRGKPEGQRRFRDAARALNQIGSPNIVEIFDFVPLPDRRVMLVLERLDGETIAAVAGREPMDPGRTIGILRQLCKALGAAHALGHLHQNIEPGNVMLVEAEGRTDTVKLLGFAFGVSPEDDEPGFGRRYASPEERVGGDADLRGDIYALGCTAHFMLTGQDPGHGSSSMLPSPLWDVIVRCMSEEPAQRYPNVLELEAALCEAQIEMGLVTAWDHLPLPDIDSQRRELIFSGMSELGRIPVSPRRRWWLPAAGLALVLATAGLSVALMSSSDVEAAALPDIESIVTEAQEAGAKAYYVYPSPQEPDHATAYAKVIELEAIDGSLEEKAKDEASRLREHFAQTLFTLGDRYWQQDEGRRFARGYYVQGLMFDPTHAQALERSGLSSDRLERLGASAAEQRFDDEELAEAEPLLVLAEDDPEERTRRMEELRERRLAEAAAEDAALQALSGGPAKSGSKPKSKSKPDAVAKPGTKRSRPRSLDDRERVVELLQAYLDNAEDETETQLISSLLEVMDKGKGKSSGSSSDAEPTPEPKRGGKRNPQAAANHVAAGRKKLKRGDYGGAEQAFHHALEADYKSAAAMAGLGSVYFERGMYQKAVSYNRKAVNTAPRKSAYRMRLGDSYFKVLRYADAKKQYKKAKSLGHRDASAALAKVAKRLGH